MTIEILDAADLAGLSRLEGSACFGGTYISSMVRNQPSAYLDNANVKMAAIVIDARVLPLVISDHPRGNSNVCSPYAHYLEYAFLELARRYRRVPAGLLKGPQSLLAAMLRSGSIDRAVFVNNWLFTTNPRHGLSSAQVAATTASLIRQYPDHAIVFRSINPVTDSPGLDALRV